MFKSKKAMSPLIATILLIAFAISIGAVIMSYGNAYYSDKPAETGDICDKVKVEIYKIDGDEQMCHVSKEGKDYLSFILFNKGSVEIDSVQILTAVKGDSNRIKIIDIPDSSITPGFTLEREVLIDNGIRDLVQVQLISQFLVGTETVKCYLDPMPINTVKTC